MITTTYSLHHIHHDDAFGFDADDYSRFKFGDGAVSKDFGIALADGFINEYLTNNPVTKQIVVISSPYSFIPTATFAMKTWFVYRLNNWLAEQGLPVVQETKVHRTITYKEDYGELDAEQRMNLIGNDKFHIDKEFLIGKTLVFLDDIRITGSHERMIMKMVDAYGLKNDIHMLYFAELINKNIHPNVENHLNYHQVKSIFDLDGIIKSGNFCINTRIVKYILNYSFDGFRVFIQNQTADFAELLYNMALGNGYHTIEAYEQNLIFIKKQLLASPKSSLRERPLKRGVLEPSPLERAG
ncbi:MULTISPECIES: phosphoribosyltransferase family protein [unclassified Mucilaginibacter]|uniref:phosphoribosyltransferase family protein n=1 Tax=unclassified Mucilaginibacter TaxID=2617802 RepID=UPI002AC89D84|nr:MULTISPECIES: phosphoribosyltransferase family protein [unclassified Mucilaginibacter]MEB0260939.1 phosphoribosyltransferase family protein [Mucilaginibacter sp. 10I4]MEB0279533.1 phosphoribosyltransferase family protein [Mucilaginibacter sp. 10B2]MEB0302278.1 phosphoribosyltransferase family protein [Mucilaginibacter sp. 5C4]WPX22599.1 phosphoribosyltransferase family protein [Mucilaginibacter sp. 5C4]